VNRLFLAVALLGFVTSLGVHIVTLFDYLSDSVWCSGLHLSSVGLSLPMIACCWGATQREWNQCWRSIPRWFRRLWIALCIYGAANAVLFHIESEGMHPIYENGSYYLADRSGPQRRLTPEEYRHQTEVHVRSSSAGSMAFHTLYILFFWWVDPCLRDCKLARAMEPNDLPQKTE